MSSLAFNLGLDLGTVKFNYKGKKYSLPVEAACQSCGKLAIVKLPPNILAEQPDDTTHVCHPTAGGCNLGFSNH